MTTINQLSGVAAEAPFSEARTSNSVLFEHQIVKGWFVRLQLGSSGLHVYRDRFDPALNQQRIEVAVPLEALLRIAAEHAPKLLPNVQEIAAFQAAPAKPAPRQANAPRNATNS